MQKVIKAGNSLAVTIPSNFVRKLGLKSGSQVEIENQVENGKLILTFQGDHQLSLMSHLKSK